MKKILHITSSPRGEDSNSTRLGRRIIEKLRNQYPGSTVTVNDLVENDYEHLQIEQIGAFKIPPEDQTSAQRAALRVSDHTVEELLDADIIVISFPLYNFNIPSSLKAWIDHAVRPGMTFTYATGRPEGLLKGKKVYLAMAANGVYSDGPMKPFNFAEPYLRYILGFVGLTDITLFRIEGSGIPGVMETATEKGLQSVEIG